MKIAYLCSQYPAVSHTFILREVQGLRRRGLDIATYSIRPARPDDLLDAQNRREADGTKTVFPLRSSLVIRSLAWALTAHPRQAVRLAWQFLVRQKLSFRARLAWIAYFLEGTILARWLTADGADRLHCHFGNSGSSPALLAAKLAGIPFSMTCHGSELLTPEKFQLPEKVRHADFVACVSKFGRAQLMRVCDPADWQKLHIVRCGLDFAEQFTTLPRTPNRKILCVGRLSAEKAHRVLLQALANLRDHDSNFHCTLVGDGPLRQAISEQVSKLDLTRQVTLTGALPSDRVLALYPAADLVVLPSFSEGVPVVLMEAMAFGCPVVATRVGGIPELVRDGLDGRLVAPGDADELAGAMCDLLDHPDTARQLGQNARARVREEFDRETSLRHLVELFSQTVFVAKHRTNYEPTVAFAKIADHLARPQ